LFEFFARALGGHARHHVECPACAKRYDQGDGPCREGRISGSGQGGGTQYGGSEQFVALLHRKSPKTAFYNKRTIIAKNDTSYSIF
jgi:hypothetical protein